MKLMFYFSYEVSISFSLSLSLHVVRDNSTGFVALIEKNSLQTRTQMDNINTQLNRFHLSG